MLIDALKEIVVKLGSISGSSGGSGGNISIGGENIDVDVMVDIDYNALANAIASALGDKYPPDLILKALQQVFNQHNLLR